jgi:beta-xylosidase
MTPKIINPIIPGFAPDPSCIRVNDTYYLVNSTFSWFPGLPIYTSKDLIHWHHVGNAINRPSQNISFSHTTTRVNPPTEWDEPMTMTGGLYAPTIRHHNSLFYVVCTNVIHHPTDPKLDTRQNFFVTSSAPESNQWSDPTFFNFDGIDTCLYFSSPSSPTSKAYIHGTSISLFEIDLSTGSPLSPTKHLWPGTGGAYPEGPHIIFRPEDGYHYLLISEGGCFDSHAVTAARSRDLWGPYEPYEKNPLLTARGTDEYVRNVGHCDVFQDGEGNWWAVVLGVRKEKGKGRYLMGRETFLTPVVWREKDGGWPRIGPVKMGVDVASWNEENGTRHQLGEVEQVDAGRPRITAEPGVDFLYLRNPDLGKHRMEDEMGKRITLMASPADLTQGGPEDHVTFVGKRMRMLEGGVSSVTLKVGDGGGTKLRAGLALYKDETRFARVYIDFQTAELVFEVRCAAREIQREDRKKLDLAQTQEVRFQMRSSEEVVRFDYALTESGQWESAGEMDSLELTGLDFTGPVVGVFAVGSEGEQAVFGGLEVQ